MKNENNITVEIQTDKEIIKELSDKFKISELDIKSLITGRAIGHSWERLTKDLKINDESIEEENMELEKEFYIKALKNNDKFKELITIKKKDFNLIDLAIEEEEIFEKLRSIMNGECQGIKMAKVQTKLFNDGKMELQEEWIEVPNYPTTAEISKASEILHKLGFLNAKDKAKVQADEDRMKLEQSDLMDEMIKIQEKSENIEEIIAQEDVKAVEIDLDNLDELLEDLSDGEEEIDVKDLQDF